MSNKTTFPFSMDCTGEQYEEVKPILKSMGYITNYYEGDIIVNNFGSRYKNIALISKRYNIDYNRIYLGEFKKELLLALCALDSDNDKGKWYKYIWASNLAFTKNKLYTCRKDNIENINSIIDNCGCGSVIWRFNSICFTPATPQEIINHFKEKEDMNTKQISQEELLKSKKFYIRGNEERYSEIEEIFRKAEASNITALSYKRDDCFYFIDKRNSVTCDECYSEKSWLLQQAFTEYKLPEKPKEYTMDEIAEALGIKVENLKIKK